MTEPLFYLSGEYDDMLSQGLSVTGEGKAYFAEGRVKDMISRLPRDFHPRRILDFGCGTGGTSELISRYYPDSKIIGVDTSENALSHARRLCHSPNISFMSFESMKDSSEGFDLCYVNGVFHHIKPSDRPDILSLVYKRLLPNSYIAFYENNPWNPGTKFVMSRIAFDRDAETFSFSHAQKLLKDAGFSIADRTRFLFYFPKVLSMLRFLEPALALLPLGAQYGVLGVK